MTQATQRPRRGWSFRLAGGITATLAALALLPASAQADDGHRYNQYGNSDARIAASVTCKSRDYRAARCPIPASGTVRLVRQISDARCVEGRSYGIQRRSIWVDDGCAAVFAVVQHNQRYGTNTGGKGGWTYGNYGKYENYGNYGAQAHWQARNGKASKDYAVQACLREAQLQTGRRTDVDLLRLNDVDRDGKRVRVEARVRLDNPRRGTDLARLTCTVNRGQITAFNLR